MVFKTGTLEELCLHKRYRSYTVNSNVNEDLEQIFRMKQKTQNTNRIKKSIVHEQLKDLSFCSSRGPKGQSELMPSLGVRRRPSSVVVCRRLSS